MLFSQGKNENVLENSVPGFRKAYSLIIEAKTWKKDSHDLFDHEAQDSQLAAELLNLDTSMDIYRRDSDVVARPIGAAPPYGSEHLCRLVFDESGISLEPSSPQNQRDPSRVFQVIPSTLDKHKSLKVGHVLKLGRYKIRVRQLETSGETKPDLELDGRPCSVGGEAHCQEPVTDASKSCRICLLDGGDLEDPLINPCECKGSIEYVHLNCVRHWIEGRLNLAEKPQNVFYFKQLHCELCKKDYASTFNIGQRPEQLVRLPTLKTPYIVLENLSREGPGDEDEEKVKALHVLSFNEGVAEMKVGRGHEAGVRIPDVSISRCHALLSFKDNQFWVLDNRSKFGTSLEIRNPQNLTPALQALDTSLVNPESVTFQVGRTLLNFRLFSRSTELEETSTSRNSSSSRSCSPPHRRKGDEPLDLSSLGGYLL